MCCFVHAGCSQRQICPDLLAQQKKQSGDRTVLGMTSIFTAFQSMKQDEYIWILCILSHNGSSKSPSSDSSVASFQVNIGLLEKWLVCCKFVEIFVPQWAKEAQVRPKVDFHPSTGKHCSWYNWYELQCFPLPHAAATDRSQDGLGSLRLLSPSTSSTKLQLRQPELQFPDSQLRNTENISWLQLLGLWYVYKSIVLANLANVYINLYVYIYIYIW